MNSSRNDDRNDPQTAADLSPDVGERRVHDGCGNTQAIATLKPHPITGEDGELHPGYGWGV